MGQQVVTKASKSARSPMNKNPWTSLFNAGKKMTNKRNPSITIEITQQLYTVNAISWTSGKKPRTLPLHPFHILEARICNFLPEQCHSPTGFHSLSTVRKRKKLINLMQQLNPNRTWTVLTSTESPSVATTLFTNSSLGLMPFAWEEKNNNFQGQG